MGPPPFYELPDPAQFDAPALQPVDDADQRRLIRHRTSQHGLNGLGDDPDVREFLQHLGGHRAPYPDLEFQCCHVA